MGDKKFADGYDISNARSIRTVHRSVALARSHVEEASALAPPPLCQNFNLVVTNALQEFVESEKARAWKELCGRWPRIPSCGRSANRLRAPWRKPKWMDSEERPAGVGS